MQVNKNHTEGFDLSCDMWRVKEITANQIERIKKTPIKQNQFVPSLFPFYKLQASEYWIQHLKFKWQEWN